MTFCSSCGVMYIQDAKYCHRCGIIVPGQTSDAASTSATEDTSGSTRSSSASKPASRGFSFSAFRLRKEDERAKFFKKGGPNPKKMKTQEKKPQDVKITVGVMIMKDGNLSVKRGASLPLTVPEVIASDDLLKKAVEKHSRFNHNLITNSPTSYRLVYGDTKEVKTIPGSEEPFTLKRYKEEIDKPYCRIAFYLCSSDDYLDNIMGSCISDSSDEELTHSIYSTSNSTNRQHKDTVTSSERVESHQPSSLSANDIHVPVGNEDLILSPQPQKIQCPICLESYPVQDIQSHADSCSMWLLEEVDEPPFGNSLNEIETESDTANVEESAMSDIDKKKALMEEISQLAKMHMLDDEPKRVTVRRKCIWEDFKKVMQGKLNPKTKLKVVFAGEPAVDDGGPRRELFSELLSIIRRKFFINGKPVQSTLAISSGDFKICGMVMGMSILQGGPAPNFMAANIASCITGSKLSPNENKDIKYKAVADNLAMATSDEQVRNLLLSDSILDVLQELGYTGIPHRETLLSVKSIIQSLCIKDQLGEYLPQLLEIQSGLDRCGILDSIRNNPEMWRVVFERGSFFKLSADAFLDQITVEFSESQLKKNTEIDSYKFFCDVIEAVDVGDVEGLQLNDVMQWLTGSCEVPPLGFPKRFTLQFVHGCKDGCKCRPTVSTCDTSVKMPIHINNVDLMREMLISAVKDSYGFGNL